MGLLKNNRSKSLITELSYIYNCADIAAKIFSYDEAVLVFCSIKRTADLHIFINYTRKVKNGVSVKTTETQLFAFPPNKRIYIAVIIDPL